MAELTIDQALQQAIEAHKAGQVQEADRLYTAILKAQPKHPDANHNMGVLAVGVGKVEQALPFFKTALEANANTAQFWLSYIDTLIKLERLADAKAVLDQARSKGAKGDGFDKLEQRLKDAGQEPLEANQIAPEAQPKQPNILDSLKLDQAISLAKKKAKEGALEEAQRIYQDILVKFPKNKRASYGITSLAEGKISKVSKAQDLPQHQLQSLMALYNNGQLALCIEQAQILTKQYPKAVTLWNLMGVAAAQNGQLDQAIFAFKRVIAIKPDYADAYSNIGNAFKIQGKLEEAVEAYNKALAIKPSNAKVCYNMGNAFKEQGKLEESIVAFNKALAVKPDYTEAYNNMGIVLKDQGELEEAIEAFNKALAIKPDYAEAYNNMGNTLGDQGKLEEAIQAFNKALAIKPDYADAYNNMAARLIEQGKLEEAIASYKKALAIKPDYAEAYTDMGIALRDQGKLEEAIEALKNGGSTKSQIHLLKCLYQLDKPAKFFGQLDHLVEQGENNAVIGSYITRSQIKYGINRTNPFCNDPLKYALHTDLASRCNFDELFIKGATDVLTKDTVQSRSQKLLTNGIQTTGNIFNQLSNFNGEIQKILRLEIESYRMSFKDSNEGFIKSWPSAYEIRGWLVSMKRGGKLAAHMHDDGWISGSVYINVPPKVNKDSGNFVVCLDSGQESKSVDVVTGSLCLFPSSLLHYTIPFEADENRIVLAFDVIPK